MTEPESRDEDGLFWLGGQDRIANIAEIDLVCSDYPDRRLVMDHAKGRRPSTRAQQYIDRSKVVQDRDAGNYCLWGSFLKALEIFAPSEIAQEFI